MEQMEKNTGPIRYTETEEKGHMRVLDRIRIFFHQLTDSKNGKKILRQAAMFVLGFLLSRITVLGGYAPFGMSFLAGLSGKPGMSAAFAGTLLSYMTAHTTVNGVKYVAVCLMVFLITLVLGRMFVTDSYLYSVTILFLCLGAVALIYAVSDPETSRVMLLYTAEMMLSVFSALMFRTALTKAEQHQPESARERQMLCVLALLALAAAALPSFTFGILTVSPGKALGMLFLLLAAGSAGVYGGVVAGLMIGLTADLSGTGIPVYTAALGIAGMLAGLFSSRGKLWMTGAFFLSMATIWVCLPGGMDNPGRLLDALAAGLAFYFVPAGASDKLGELFVTGVKTQQAHGQRVKSFVCAKLSGLAAAYEELADTVACQEEAAGEITEAELFGPACKACCVECAGRDECWKTPGLSMRAALRKTAQTILARGSAQPEDFPPEFLTRCRNLSVFVAIVNQSLFKERTKRRYQSELNENRRILCRQYGQLAQAIDSSVDTVSESFLFDERLEQRIKSFLYEAGIPCEVLAYRDQNEVLHIELCGENLRAACEELEALTEIISQIAGCSFSLPEQLIGRDIQCFSFTETADFTCLIGAAAEKRPGHSISGDCGTYFIGKNNCTYVILCDGMGSGEAAREESKKAVRLLESFIKAGISPEQAAEIITSALLLDSQSQRFATMDIAEINVRTGQLTLVKCGAAPAFLRRPKREGGYFVTELWPGGPDVVDKGGENGVYTLLRPRVIKQLLNEGDMLFLVSDGVYSTDNPEFRLSRYIAKLSGDQPRELAEMVLRMTRGETAEDDKTVIAVLFQRGKNNRLPQNTLTDEN
jgi:stage II sporulation protein E